MTAQSLSKVPPVANQNPVAIVTGAGSGIGRSVCVQLAERGWRLALVGRTVRKLDETAAMLARDSRSAQTLVIAADIAESAAPAMIVERTVQQFGRIDALVNNAAIAPECPIDQRSDELMQAVFATNVFGPAGLIACCWPVFARQRGGCAVNVSSTAAFDPFTGLAAYAASKCALDSLTRSIHVEGGDLGIRAFSVAPGAVETAMLRELVSEAELPRERTLAPEAVALVIVDCVLGRRDRDMGSVIRLPSP